MNPILLMIIGFGIFVSGAIVQSKHEKEIKKELTAPPEDSKTGATGNNHANATEIDDPLPIIEE